MINLDKIKIVLWGFDDTLCIHEFHSGDSDSKRMYNFDVLFNGKDAWNMCKPNIFMKKFMNLCLNKNIKQGLISTTISYKHATGKCEWVRENYGIELENFCVGTYKAKIDMMLAISDAYDYEKYEILIVDGFGENLERAADNGFQACSPMEVVNYILDKGYDV